MSLYSRRAMLGSTAMAATAVAISGCAGQTSDQLTADVKLLVSGLSAVMSTLSDPALNIPAATLSQINAALADLNTNAASIGTALAPNASSVQAIGNIVSTLATLVTPYFGLAPVVAMVVKAALALIPTILSFIPAPVAPAGAKAAAAGMSPDEARLVLAAAPAMVKH